MNSELGLVTLKSTASYLGIRAQKRKTYKYEATQIENASRRRIQKRDLGSLGFIFFLFFSFLFFSFLFCYFRRFRADCFCSFILFFFIFLGSECYR